VFGFGVFGGLHAWQGNTSSHSAYQVDADTITGGAGTSMLFGEIGDDTIYGGSGNEKISGGFGFNTLSGGGGVNLISFDRAHDTHVSTGGTDIARGLQVFTAVSGDLAVNTATPLMLEIAGGIEKNVAVGATVAQGVAENHPAAPIPPYTDAPVVPAQDQSNGVPHFIVLSLSPEEDDTSNSLQVDITSSDTPDETQVT